jgi:thiamine monophosphate synthase
MLVTDRALVPEGALSEVVAAAVAGGVDAVQVREKDLPDEALLALVQQMLRAVAGRAVVLVNGRLSVALAAGVGLHLPEEADVPAFRTGGGFPKPQRSLAVVAVGDATAAAGDKPPRSSRGAGTSSEGGGSERLWGRSVHSAGAAAAAAVEGADYAIAGPLFATTSHPGAPALGEVRFREIAAAAGSVPVLAIGGITPERVRTAVAAGAAGVAVRSDVLGARDPERAARQLQRQLHASLEAIPMPTR